MDSDLDWISHEALARLAGAHPTTVRRWKLQARAGGLVPPWLARLVNTVHRGYLAEINPAWRGWLINPHDGLLVTPEGVSVTQGQIRALPSLYELRRVLERELLQLREAMHRLEIRLQAPVAPARGPCRISRRFHTASELVDELILQLRAE